MKLSKQEIKDAAFFVVITQNASVSHLKKGLGRTKPVVEQILEEIESVGVVGPKRETDTESRTVLVRSIGELEDTLRDYQK